MTAKQEKHTEQAQDSALIGPFVLDKGILRNWDGEYIANPSPDHAEGLLALLNTLPTTPNAPSPEVIEKLVEACKATASFNSHEAMQAAKAKAQSALALIDGEKK